MGFRQIIAKGRSFGKRLVGKLRLTNLRLRNALSRRRNLLDLLGSEQDRPQELTVIFTRELSFDGEITVPEFTDRASRAITKDKWRYFYEPKNDTERRFANLGHSYSLTLGSISGKTTIKTGHRTPWSGCFFSKNIYHVYDWTAKEIQEEPHGRVGPILNDRANGKTEHYATLISFVHRFSSDFGHFFSNTFYALLECRTFLIEHPEISILIDSSMPTALEYLRFLEIDPARVVKYDPEQDYSCDRFYFVVFNPKPYDGFNLTFQSIRRHCESLHKRQDSESPSVIIAPRVKEKHQRNVGRKWVNFEYFIEKLQENGISYHVFDSSKASLEQTITLFQHARWVIGPIGSALHNSVFCPANATVIEFYPEYLMGTFYRVMHYISIQCGLRYYLHVCRASGWGDDVVLPDDVTETIIDLISGSDCQQKCV